MYGDQEGLADEIEVSVNQYRMDAGNFSQDTDT